MRRRHARQECHPAAFPVECEHWPVLRLRSEPVRSIPPGVFPHGEYILLQRRSANSFTMAASNQDRWTDEVEELNVNVPLPCVAAAPCAGSRDPNASI